ncbi:MAG: hypothetical protein OHK005_00640 [Candidatus Methylacidiphilales bacterium]
MEKKINEGLVPRNKTSGHANGFAESAHLDMDSVPKLGRSKGTSSERANNAGGVCLIDEKPSTEPFGQVGKLMERCPVAIHREEAFRDQQDPSRRRRAVTDGIEDTSSRRGIVMVKNPDSRT